MRWPKKSKDLRKQKAEGLSRTSPRFQSLPSTMRVIQFLTKTQKTTPRTKEKGTTMRVRARAPLK